MADTSLLGVTLANRFTITGVIGEGGMATVYRAALPDGTVVALKIMAPELAKETRFVRRFRREAKAAALLDHPNTVRIVEFGVDGGRVYLAMELLQGIDLATLLHRERKIPEKRALQLGVQICRALSAAHAHNIVHRDLKPDNIMLVRVPASGANELPDLGPSDFVKVLDFGIAKILDSEDGEKTLDPRADPITRDKSILTRVGTIVGTPAYMAPEQGRAEPVDARTDLYALGVLLYELVTGRVPFTGETPMQVVMRHVNEPPRPPSDHVPVSPAFERLILRALAKWPGQRPASADAFAAELLTLLGVAPEAAAEVGTDSVAGITKTLVIEPPDLITTKPPAPPVPAAKASSPARAPASRPSRPAASTGPARPFHIPNRTPAGGSPLGLAVPSVPAASAASAASSSASSASSKAPTPLPASAARPSAAAPRPARPTPPVEREAPVALSIPAFPTLNIELPDDLSAPSAPSGPRREESLSGGARPGRTTARMNEPPGGQAVVADPRAEPNSHASRSPIPVATRSAAASAPSASRPISPAPPAAKLVEPTRPMAHEPDDDDDDARTMVKSPLDELGPDSQATAVRPSMGPGALAAFEATQLAAERPSELSSDDRPTVDEPIEPVVPTAEAAAGARPPDASDHASDPASDAWNEPPAEVEIEAEVELPFAEASAPVVDADGADATVAVDPGRDAKVASERLDIDALFGDSALDALPKDAPIEVSPSEPAASPLPVAAATAPRSLALETTALSAVSPLASLPAQLVSVPLAEPPALASDPTVQPTAPVESPSAPAASLAVDVPPNLEHLAAPIPAHVAPAAPAAAAPSPTAAPVPSPLAKPPLLAGPAALLVGMLLGALLVGGVVVVVLLLRK